MVSFTCFTVLSILYFLLVLIHFENLGFNFIQGINYKTIIEEYPENKSNKIFIIKLA